MQDDGCIGSRGETLLRETRPGMPHIPHHPQLTSHARLPARRQQRRHIMTENHAPRIGHVPGEVFTTSRPRSPLTYTDNPPVQCHVIAVAVTTTPHKPAMGGRLRHDKNTTYCARHPPTTTTICNTCDMSRPHTAGMRTDNGGLSLSVGTSMGPFVGSLPIAWMCCPSYTDVTPPTCPEGGSIVA